MAAVIAPLFMAAGGTGAAAAGTGAAAATSTGVFGTGISASALLSGAATIGGALATIGASRAQAQSYKQQALETEVESVASDTQATQRQTAMKRELLRVLGENTVAAAASGIDIGSGLGAETNEEAKRKASRELSIDRSSQDARRAMFRARASGFRSMAKQAKSAGLWQAFGQVAQGGMDILERG